MQAIIFIIIMIVFMGAVRNMREKPGRTPPRMPQTPPARTPTGLGYGNRDEAGGEDGADGEEEAVTPRAARVEAGNRASTPELRELAQQLISRAQALGMQDERAARGAREAVDSRYPLESYAVQPPEGVDMHPAHQRYRSVRDDGEAEGSAAAAETNEDPYGVFSLGEDALARAMVLREVLGPPVSRRRHR